MNPTAATRTTPPLRDDRTAAAPRDRLARVADEDLERALRAVSWNPKDVANFLRTHAMR